MPARIMAALLLASCDLAVSGLSAVAPARDAGVTGQDAAARLDATSAPDTGLPDAALDAGHDAGADATVPELDATVDATVPELDATVDATVPELDATVDAALPPTCDTLFGTAPGYVFCWEEPGLCAFNADTAGGNCAGICSGFGVACLGAVDNWSGCDPTGNLDDTCQTNRASEICLCERS